MNSFVTPTRRGRVDSTLAVAFGLVLVAAGARAQEAASTPTAAAVERTDGRTTRGALVGSTGDGADRAFQVRAVDGTEVQLAWEDVLTIHGTSTAPQAVGEVVARLVGGSLIVGSLRTGDSAGETFEIASASLGTLALSVDRLEVLVFRNAVGEADLDDFALDADAAGGDEAIFRRARVGFDRLFGGIHRFGPTDLSFEPDRGGGAGDGPRRFDYDDLVAIAVRGGIEREVRPDVHVLTRTGDAVFATLRGVRGDVVEIEVEPGIVSPLRLRDVCAMTLLGDDRVFLSDLEPKRVEESGWFDGDGPLLPLRVDRNVVGGYLVSGNRAHGRGLGVHSRSLLTYTVPAGCTSFVARVGVDDSVRALPVRADVSIRVAVDDAQRFERTEVRTSDDALVVGPLAVKPGGVLTLEVDFGAGLDLGDRVDWLAPVFLR